MWGTVIGGLGILVALATLIGVASDRQARDAGWNRIAAARRANQEHARANDDTHAGLALWAAELDARERRLARREKLADAGPEKLPDPA